jgi:hypothetical protein
VTGVAYTFYVIEIAGHRASYRQGYNYAVGNSPANCAKQPSAAPQTRPR